MRIKKGFTLIELLITTSILAILISVAHQNLANFVIDFRVNNEITKLHRLLLVARNFSINHQQNVTLCPLNEQLECDTQWQNPISIFIDRNNNNCLDQQSDETIIQFKNKIKSGDLLLYGKNRKKIIYKPTGQLSGLSNGTFRYCPFEHYDMAKGIVVARSGRVYISTDVDSDGKDENRSRQELSCIP